MINPFFANLFFITATAVMFMTVFVATVLLVHIIKLIHIFDDILDSVKRTVEKVENVSNSFTSVLDFLGPKTKIKKVAKKKTKDND